MLRPDPRDRFETAVIKDIAVLFVSAGMIFTGLTIGGTLGYTMAESIMPDINMIKAVTVGAGMGTGAALGLAIARYSFKP